MAAIDQKPSALSVFNKGLLIENQIGRAHV